VIHIVGIQVTGVSVNPAAASANRAAGRRGPEPGLAVRGAGRRRGARALLFRFKVLEPDA
jgi:hypothetical protein